MRPSSSINRRGRQQPCARLPLYTLPPASLTASQPGNAQYFKDARRIRWCHVAQRFSRCRVAQHFRCCCNARNIRGGMAGDAGTATGAVFYAWHAAEIEKQRNSVGPTAAGTCGGHAEDMWRTLRDMRRTDMQRTDMRRTLRDMRRTCGGQTCGGQTCGGH